jgi:nitrogen fixation NifU-like protein
LDDDVLYREEILDHYHSSSHRGRLESPDLAAELDNPLCGDHIHMDLCVDPEGRIREVRFDGHGCAISQAATSMLAERVEGLSLVEARRISSEDVVKMLGVRLTPTRMKCGLLGWRVLQHAIPREVSGSGG